MIYVRDVILSKLLTKYCFDAKGFFVNTEYLKM